MLHHVPPVAAIHARPGHALGDRAATVRLQVDRAGLVPGGATVVTVLLAPAPGWHLYGPGSAGTTPPEITWRLPPGIRAGAIAYPPARPVAIEGLVVAEYDRPVALRVVLRARPSVRPQLALPIVADVRWLACSNVCVPGGATVAGTLDVVAR